MDRLSNATLGDNYCVLEDDQLIMRKIILGISPISILLGIFVIATYLTFPEKRAVGSWILNVLVVLSTVTTNIALFTGAAAGYDSLRKEPTEDEPCGKATLFCEIQAGVLVFAGGCLMWFWFFITMNLFSRIFLEKEFQTKWACLLGISFSVLMVIPPYIVDHGYGFDGGWCFINNWQRELLFADYYGWMGVCSVSGAVMWVVLMCKLYKTNDSNRLPRAVASYSSVSVSNLNSTRESQKDNNFKRRLLVRQMLFVTLFLLIFLIFFINRIITIVSEATSSWVFHTLVMTTLGIYSFFIFGFKKQNFDLWMKLIRRETLPMRPYGKVNKDEEGKVVNGEMEY